jgi:Sulfotransferase domain
MHTTRICLWSSPRNISTAMMYSFAQRPDTIVFDEPLYAHYLRVTGVVHPGQEEILASQENDGNKVVNELMLGKFDKPVAFFKQMTHHLVQLNEDFLSQMKNILFIRDPKQIISSYAQVRPDVNMQDIGIEKQWQLFQQLTANNQHCVVLDSNEILKAPEKVLTELCTAIDIPFYSAMLHWPTGPKPEDGVWAKYWYDNVHKSTGFEKQVTSSRTLPEYLEPLYTESKKYYDQLFQHSIKA